MQRIKLRALTSLDISKTLEWHNQEDIINLYSGHPFPVNLEMEKKWYEKILFSNFPLSVFGIDFIESNTLIGITALKEINMINRNAEFAIYIGDNQFRGKGLAKEATNETLNFGFNKLGLHRIYLRVLSENLPAISLYEKLGFFKEGVLRESVFKNNKFIDEIIMSVIINERI